jgi:hypothetical protein
VRHKDRYAKYLKRMFVCAERAIHEGSLEAPSNGGAE